jgi:hypothetical protein
VRALDPAAPSDAELLSLSEMDAPGNMAYLHKLGALAGARDMQPGHFSSAFDLPAALP